MNDPGFPVFDADNHLYESPAWLEYLPPSARGVAGVARRARLSVERSELERLRRRSEWPVGLKLSFRS
jgi:hypothetical protein